MHIFNIGDDILNKLEKLELLKILLFKSFPEGLLKSMENVNLEKVDEIRIRVDKPVILKVGVNDIIVNYKVSSDEILNLFQVCWSNSIYTYQNQICGGFITIPGGHRVGISGSVVVKDGKVTNITNLYSLNIRIAKEIPNCSMPLLQYVIDIEKNTVFNTLIVSSPGAGKTTMLRDIVNKISNGMPEINFKGVNVSVIDERGEISAMHKGVPQNDIGIRTDVLDNVPKVLGIRMAIRSLAPQVVIADEIGNKDDAEIINYAICSGVKGIFTAHGSCFTDLKLNPEINKLINLKIFERIIFLDSFKKGNIKNVIIRKKLLKFYFTNR